MTEEIRTINCPNCGHYYEGDWSGVDCRGCGDFRNPTHAEDTSDLLLPGEVVRILNGDLLAAVKVSPCETSRAT